MSRASTTAALLAPPSPASIWPVAVMWRPSWRGLDSALARTLTAIGDGARIAWWDGSAIGLHLNGLLGLFEVEGSLAGSDRT